MRLPEICIRQPVLAIVLNLVLIVVGIVSYENLDIRFFPDLTIPVMSIKTRYAGAGAELIESSITTPIENAIADVPDVETVTSSSSNDQSSITVYFKLGGKMEQAANAIRDKVSSIRDKIPVDADPPVFTVGGNAGSALSIGFTDENRSSARIRDYVSRYVTPQIREIADVGGISTYGASSYAMRIWLDAHKMGAMGVTVSDVKTVLNSNNIDFPAGRVIDPDRQYTIVSDTRLKTPEEFANLIIKSQDGHVVRFKDIAKVELGSSSLQDAPMRINGKPAIDLEVKPLKGANPITVAAAVRKQIVRISKNLPPGMHVSINYDQSEFLKAAIDETFKAIGEAVLLVVLIVYLFLGSVRASTVPIVTIPLCIIAVFGVMYMLGFTINVMTLLAIVLAIGLVVDDAIVMLENIYRHVEEGMEPFAAAIRGSKEIGFAIIAMTITLAAVYAPIGFAKGFTAVVFKEFAFTLAASVIISGFVALTLSPMMCSKLLRKDDSQHGLMQWIDDVFHRLDKHYRSWLQTILHHRFWVVIVLFAILVLGYVLFKSMPSEFVPQEDTGLIVTSVTSPSGSTVDYTNQYMRQIEKVYAKVPEVQSYYSMISSGSATSYITLKPWTERKRTTDEIVKELAPELAKVTGVDAYPYMPDPIDYGEGGTDIGVQIMTAGDYDQLSTPVDAAYKLLLDYPGLTNVKRSLKYDSQQYAITINRDLAADLQVSVQDIADTMSAMLGGAHITDIMAEGSSYQVIVQIEKEDLRNFIGIQKLYVRNAVGSMIPLANLIKLTPRVGQPSLPHYNRMRSARVTAQLAPGYTMSQAINYLDKHLPSVMGSKARYAYDGKAKQYLETRGNMAELFLLALIFIYLVLSAQFGSFIDPFIILLTVPLCIVGALFTLKMTGGSLNLYSQIGLVTLVGLISKHGILITQFANSRRAAGDDLFAAVVNAAATRLRPILMTTLAMVLGAIPLAIASGPGSIGRSQIGWVIVGGLTFGTFFSLVVVPVAYTYLGRFKQAAHH